MLNAADQALIETAVREAERRTRGEIYCVLAAESSDYHEVPLAWAAGAALLGPALLLLFGVTVAAPEALQGWTAAQVGAAAEAAAHNALLGAVLLQGVLFVAVLLLGMIPPVRRLLTPRGLKRHRVRQHAQELFIAKGLHATRERTGVLLFVSQAEHMVELVADEGIDAKVEQDAWDQTVAVLVEGIKRGAAAEGFTAAIARCADILAEHFPPDAADNPNELPDALVLIPPL